MWEILPHAGNLRAETLAGFRQTVSLEIRNFGFTAVQPDSRDAANSKSPRTRRNGVHMQRQFSIWRRHEEVRRHAHERRCLIAEDGTVAALWYDPQRRSRYRAQQFNRQ